MAFCVFGFAKNAKSNIANNDVKDLKEYADALLSLSVEQINTALKKKELVEVKDEKNKRDEKEGV